MTYCARQCGGYYTVCPFRSSENGWGVCPYDVPPGKSSRACEECSDNCVEVEDIEKTSIIIPADKGERK